MSLHKRVGVNVQSIRVSKDIDPYIKRTLEGKEWVGEGRSFEKRIEDEPKCLHLTCPECHGTGKKSTGEMCIHFISCPCPRCTPQFRSFLN